MIFPLEVSFARKISLDHELETVWPKISVFVPEKVPVTKIFPEESVAVE
jgi:hypothetical protein